MGASGRWIKASVGFTQSDKSRSSKKDEHVTVATKSQFERQHSVDFGSENFHDRFKEYNTHSIIDTGVSTSTSLQSYDAAYEEQRQEHLAATRIQTAYRGFLARRALRALKGLVVNQRDSVSGIARCEKTSCCNSSMHASVSQSSGSWTCKTSTSHLGK